MTGNWLETTKSQASTFDDVRGDELALFGVEVDKAFDGAVCGQDEGAIAVCYVHDQRAGIAGSGPGGIVLVIAPHPDIEAAEGEIRVVIELHDLDAVRAAGGDAVDLLLAVIQGEAGEKLPYLDAIEKRDEAVDVVVVGMGVHRVIDARDAELLKLRIDDFAAVVGVRAVHEHALAAAHQQNAVGGAGIEKVDPKQRTVFVELWLHVPVQHGDPAGLGG